MTSYSVELNKIGVCYKLHKEKVFSLKEAAIGTARRTLGRLIGKDINSNNVTDFWAIRNLSFNVRRGTSFGLVGRNGAGKSTALKVVSGVLFPTEGELWVRGRVSALVELGAGFDPELTGRENIYFGASVAGLSRKEAALRIDRIIDFAELHEFIDIPVKNYSSGMYARLGFAVATDVDPDVLIVDEILSVGDAPFQAKCIDRMNKFKKLGKTILFVSHEIERVKSFCDEIATLDHGKLISIEQNKLS